MPQVFNADSDNGLGSVNTSNVLYVVRADYTNLTSGIGADVMAVTGGTNAKLIFEEGGSLVSYGSGSALVLQTTLPVIVNAGSTLASDQWAIRLTTAGTLDLANFGRI